MVTDKTIDDLIKEGYHHMQIVSGETHAFLPFEDAFATPLRTYSIEELESWLEEKDIPQLASGAYWREFSDYSIYGKLETEVEPPGATEFLEPYFCITISQQSPAPLRLS